MISLRIPYIRGPMAAKIVPPSMFSEDRVDREIQTRWRDLSLKVIQNGEALTPATLAAAQRKSMPIIIKQGKKFSIYGCKDKQWQMTKLNNLLSSESEYDKLDSLNFTLGRLTDWQLDYRLIEIIKKGHTHFPLMLLHNNYEDFFKMLAEVKEQLAAYNARGFNNLEYEILDSI